MTLAFDTSHLENDHVTSWSNNSLNTGIEMYPGELAELRQQSYQQKQIIEAMPTGLIILDGAGIVIRVNKIARTLLNEPILGQAWFEVIKRSFEPKADDWHEVSLKDGRRVKLEISPLANEPGQLIIITDLTETRLLQDKLSQMQRLSSLGKMVSSLAHQIRTPLSAAMLYAANLSTPNLEKNARNNFQHKLMSRLQDLESQVTDMLLFARDGKDQLVEELCINQLLNGVVQGMESLVSKANAKVNITLAEQSCSIVGNKTSLSGAIQNLVQNALQEIPSNAEIHLRAECTKTHAIISIKDNGKGIDTRLKDKIFEPFYTAKANGTGLGLAVVKSVVNSHNGEISLVNNSNTSDAEGAEFLIKLPLSASVTSISKNDNKNEDVTSIFSEHKQARNNTASTNTESSHE